MRVQYYARIRHVHPIFRQLYIYRGPASRLFDLADVILRLESWRADVRELVHRGQAAGSTLIARQASRRAPLPARRGRRDGRHPARRPTRRPLERVSELGSTEAFRKSFPR